VECFVHIKSFLYQQASTSLAATIDTPVPATLDKITSPI
jgi:hypothetical protein